MKIATFNINGINTKLPGLLQWLAQADPDVVCLQELKSTDKQFPAAAIQEAGYRAMWKGQQFWNGVAILSKTEIVPVRRELPGDPSDTQSRYLEAAVGGVLVGCLYLPNGNPLRSDKFQYKLRWFERLIEHAATLVDNGHRVVLAGDYNVVATDEDIYDPKSWKRDALLQPETRACYARLLAQGWLDALLHKHGRKAFTFWDYFRNHWERDAGLRIDHLLLNAELAPELVDAGVDRWVRGLPKPSDHAPVWVELDLGRATKKKPRKPVPKRTTKPKATGRSRARAPLRSRP
ncbi:MAG TPA: exodeoxyribonuclease III [Kofleriaceae bacterium]|nr:exodeoxyribonuclease III [Kofleriaceae bacterium]